MKTYSKLIDSINKRVVTKNHTIKPKITKEIKAKLDEIRLTDLLKWHDEENEKSVYALYTKTTTEFRTFYQPWYEVWRMAMKAWTKSDKKELTIQRIMEIESDHLGIDIRTLNAD